MGSRGRPGRDGVEDLRLDEVVDAQRLGCEAAGSPLYATVLDAVVDDVVTDGPSRRLGPSAATSSATASSTVA